MDEHEVPTHVQAEDRVLLWFTFPQLVALTAVAAVAYGVYQVAPFGPEAVRAGAGLVFALVGAAFVVGRVGGRRLPAVAADLLRFGFGARRFSGPPSELVRSAPPAAPGAKEETEAEPAEPQRFPLLSAQHGPQQSDATVDTALQRSASDRGPVQRAARKLASLRRPVRTEKRPRTRGQRMPLRPRSWFRKHDRKRPSNSEYAEARQALARPRAEPEAQEQRDHRFVRWPALLGGAAALAVVASITVCSPPLALADEGEQEIWTSDEIEFDPPPLIPGRRLYIERLTVTREAATVVVRAAADLEVEARAFGGADGRQPRFQREDTLGRNGRSSYLAPLDGPAPSLTFAWRDEHGQAGALSLAGDQLPYPLPEVRGELCDLRLVRLSWREGTIEGSVRSDCRAGLDEPVELETASGHARLSHTALLPADVTSVSGAITLAASGRQTSAPFVANGETLFTLALGASRAILAVEITAALSAELRIALPPLVRLTHRPYRLERRTETVTLVRPGTSQTVSETVSWTDDEGNTSSQTVSATLSIPSATVQKQVTLEIEHDEHVRAELVQRPALTKTRTEQLTLGSGIAADNAYRALVVPEREPERPASVQTRLTEAELNELFAILGWGP